MKRITLKDVAQKAGVSTALVSYVLNNRMTGRINEETAAKIKKAAEALNYRPNHIAQSLKLQRTNTIGLIVADIANPFASGLARIIEDEAQKHNCTLIIGSSDENAQKSQRLIDTFVNRQVDGLIIAPVENTESQIQQLITGRVPFVLLDRYFPGVNTDNVSLKNYEASFDAIQHLVEADRKKIGIVAYTTDLFHLQERVRGAKDALRKNDLEAGEEMVGWISVNNIEADVEKAVLRFLSDVHIDALFFTSNLLAIAGLKVLVAQKIIVPQQVAIVAFDETDAFDLFAVPLTYIRQPLPEMGREAVSILMKKINNPDKAEEHAIFDATLIVRQSSGL